MRSISQFYLQGQPSALDGWNGGEGQRARPYGGEGRARPLFEYDLRRRRPQQPREAGRGRERT